MRADVDFLLTSGDLSNPRIDYVCRILRPEPSFFRIRRSLIGPNVCDVECKNRRIEAGHNFRALSIKLVAAISVAVNHAAIGMPNRAIVIARLESAETFSSA